MNVGYRLGGPDIVHEKFGGDLVVLNLASGQYFGLNPSAAALWEIIVEGRSVTEETAAGALEFVEKLLELGLIASSSEVNPTPSAPLNLDGLPTIEVYDDLSDLIVADPIHDVDEEAGWPKLPDSQ